MLWSQIDSIAKEHESVLNLRENERLIAEAKKRDKRDRKLSRTLRLRAACTPLAVLFLTLTFFGLGFTSGLNYPMQIFCTKKDLICSLRVVKTPTPIFLKD